MGRKRSLMLAAAMMGGPWGGSKVNHSLNWKPAVFLHLVANPQNAEQLAYG